ncbi:hypothetical protein Agabi119p4_387 [Agaricus bisporus var. burnettii]|uniref:Uncharacterized protein n=1 Tax=Agaricus bisporus var. burnettii TaxID=192524 RepID=A0A8H7FAH3_AGABI|nr:hypothetical protein Agabi119p4_387 [Agaricus bisporus var. burnettii]
MQRQPTQDTPARNKAPTRNDDYKDTVDILPAPVTRIYWNTLPSRLPICPPHRLRSSIMQPSKLTSLKLIIISRNDFDFIWSTAIKPTSLPAARWTTTHESTPLAFF